MYSLLSGLLRLFEQVHRLLPRGLDAQGNTFLHIAMSGSTGSVWPWVNAVQFLAKRHDLMTDNLNKQDNTAVDCWRKMKTDLTADTRLEIVLKFFMSNIKLLSEAELDVCARRKKARHLQEGSRHALLLTAEEVSAGRQGSAIKPAATKERKNPVGFVIIYE
jgi:hypothetical protein